MNINVMVVFRQRKIVIITNKFTNIKIFSVIIKIYKSDNLPKTRRNIFYLFSKFQFILNFLLLNMFYYKKISIYYTFHNAILHFLPL